MTRTFEDKIAVREKTPLLIGLVSPSGAGKTYSALRLATGIQRVSPGEIFGIDTEARRMLHYADKFKFRHVPFGQPFAPADYMAAIEYCISKGAKTIVVDSMSHEHEGPGGVLEWHEAVLDKMAGTDFKKRDKMQMAAWAKPKAARRKLINFVLQQSVNFIFCFRAKEKIKMKKGQEPEARGFGAISGSEWIFEMQLKCLLLPGSDGVPTWRSDMPGEQQIIKLPEQFRPMFSSGPQLTEDVGERLAAWAAGAEAPKPMTADELLDAYVKCGNDSATFGRLESKRAVAWAKLSKEDKSRVKLASDEAKERIELAARTFESTSTDGEDQDEDEDNDDGFAFDPEAAKSDDEAA